MSLVSFAQRIASLNADPLVSRTIVTAATGLPSGCSHLTYADHVSRWIEETFPNGNHSVKIMFVLSSPSYTSPPIWRLTLSSFTLMKRARRVWRYL